MNIRICKCLHVCVYIYIYIWREREREIHIIYTPSMSPAGAGPQRAPEICK